jgi:polar amino acid transport system substrate-binding protein
VLAEADRRLEDISISFEALPAERSLKLVDAGINDGDCCRIPEVIYRTHNNMVTVPVSFHAVRFSAFSKRRDIAINSFDDLKPYSIGTVKGWKAAVDGIQQLAPAEVHIVTRPEQLFMMLQQDRIDFGVMGYLSGLKVISELQLRDIRAIDPPLLEEKLFLLLASRNQSLVPEFTRVFNEMIDDGTTERLFKKITSKL